jgi:hypothetical protein
MTSVRRWYLYVSATIGLQVVVWALISLFRSLLSTGGTAPGETLAWQIALIIVGLPFWLVHWLWSERIAAQNADERASVLRRLYLLWNVAAFWLAVALNIKSLLLVVLHLITGVTINGEIADPLRATLHAGTALTVLGAFIALNLRAARIDEAATAGAEGPALVRRLYYYLIALVALSSWATAAAALLRLIGVTLFTNGPLVFESDILRWTATVPVAVGFWLYAWLQVQQRHAAGMSGERESLVRYFYLYLWIVIGALTALGNLVRLIATLARWALGLPLETAYLGAIAWGLVGLFVWYFHNRTLNQDIAQVAEAPRQAGIRRLAWYLVAAIGQATSLFALGALLTLLIRALLVGGPGDLRGVLAAGVAALLVGVPTWLLLWRRIQAAAMSSEQLAEGERISLVRRIYLYGFVFVAAVTLLGSLIFVVFRPLSVLFGSDPGTTLLADVLQTLVYAAIAGGVLAAHGRSLSRDSAARTAAATARQREVPTLILNSGPQGEALKAQLQRVLPQLPLTLLDPQREAAAQLSAAALVVGVVPDSAVSGTLLDAVTQHARRRLLVPLAGGAWDWAGVPVYDWTGAGEALAEAIGRFVLSDVVESRTKLSPLAIFGLIVAGLILALFLLQLGVAFVMGGAM